MNLRGTIDIAADRATVWSFLLDPDRLASCVPGVGEVRQIDDSTFEGSISAVVGPITGRFSFTTRITETDEPKRLGAEVDGTESVTASRLTARVTAELRETAPDTTAFSYAAKVTTHGRLAIVGDMILRATANLIFAEFARCLQAQLAPAETVG